MMIRWLRREQPRSFALLTLLVGFGLILSAILVIVPPTPTRIAMSQPMPTTEHCTTCHSGIEAISAMPQMGNLSCVACHGGDSFAVTKAEAHANMVRNPGALDAAGKACGTCHPAQVAIVQRNVMSTDTGVISLVRRMYGLQPDGQALYASKPAGALQAFTVQADDPQPLHQFADNCLSCHLSATPINSSYFYRSTGCSSCHTLYSDRGLYQGRDLAIPKDKPGYPAYHQLTTVIPYGQCNHCHNRGNYDLRTMTFVGRTDLPSLADLSAEAARAQECYQPIGFFTRCEFELDCVDCHTPQEVMGNGIVYNNRSEAAYIRCSTCHGTRDSLPAQRTIQDVSDSAIRLSQLNPQVDDLKVGTTIMVTEHDEPLWNIYRDGNQWVMTGKATGILYTVPLVAGSKCEQKPDQQRSHYCHECHAYDHHQTTEP